MIDNRVESGVNRLNGVLKELINLMNQNFASFDECLMAYIEFGIDKSGFETGMVSEIKGESYTILQTKTWNKQVKKGMVMNLSDTFCNEACETGKTMFHNKLKNTDHYNSPARKLLLIEAIICTPLFVNDKIYGTLNFCSRREWEKSEDWYFLTNLVELLGQSLSKIIQENQLREKLKEDKKLLEIGFDLFKIATYKRNLKTGEINCTEGFYNLFGIDNELEGETKYFANFLPQIADIDKEFVIKTFNESKSKSIPAFEYRVMRKDGSFKWLRHEVMFEGDNGYVLGLVQDVSSLRESQKKLETKNKEVEQFAYATAHDLQEPLRTITAYTNILKKKYESEIDEDGQQFLTFLYDASNRMRKQIDGLLILSRIGRSSEIENVDINKMFEELLSDCEFDIRKNNAIVQYDHLPIVMGYPVELRMLLQNFLSNSLKFKHKKIAPQINFSFTEDNDFWYFNFSDNGIGIEENNIPKIFNLFTRLNSNKAFEGTGIGLTHCRKIIEIHKGEIGVKSQIDKGTSFQFSLKKLL